MILHREYHDGSDNYRDIRADLELQETVTALEKLTARQACTFTGVGVAVRAPGENYVVGNNVHNELEGWSPENLAAELVRRGLQSGDQLTLVACWAGAEGGYGQTLAATLGTLGRDKVRVRGPKGYVHWTKNGDIALADYPTGDAIKRASKAQTKGEDAACLAYVQALKSRINAVILGLEQAQTATADALVRAFASERPQQGREAVDQLLRKTSTDRPLPADTMAGIVTAAQAKLLSSPETTRVGWNQELRSLLTALHSVKDRAAGPAAAAAEITTATAALRASLAQLWPRYSEDYYDAMRASCVSNPFDPAFQWEDHTSSTAHR
ncbi:hypothetical protein [Streptacidiphilus anmyonensis]|uniref:hypothetical protein n=1 Tax=Streptacidiphilus anmyonensis TaxID=405782 RepID=UPI0005A99BA2|nr:hypothetical protein [Streptacidiphilus anmyonensis]